MGMLRCIRPCRFNAFTSTAASLLGGFIDDGHFFERDQLKQLCKPISKAPLRKRFGDVFVVLAGQPAVGALSH
jgi:hypothetical protein